MSIERSVSNVAEQIFNTLSAILCCEFHEDVYSNNFTLCVTKKWDRRLERCIRYRNCIRDLIFDYTIVWYLFLEVYSISRGSSITLSFRSNGLRFATRIETVGNNTGK